MLGDRSWRRLWGKDSKKYKKILWGDEYIQYLDFANSFVYIKYAQFIVSIMIKYYRQKDNERKKRRKKRREMGEGQEEGKKENPHNFLKCNQVWSRLRMKTIKVQLQAHCSVRLRDDHLHSERTSWADSRSFDLPLSRLEIHTNDPYIL